MDETRQQDNLSAHRCFRADEFPPEPGVNGNTPARAVHQLQPR
ncbi:hypothetical protein [Streptomyces atratus]|nr:hypothetical protein [Streptomyces atratus]MCX5345424.1 hypothetical protein [Streptomyces atratus]